MIILQNVPTYVINAIFGKLECLEVLLMITLECKHINIYIQCTVSAYVKLNLYQNKGNAIIGKLKCKALLIKTEINTYLADEHE